jgi:hypothetical protein
LSYSVTEREQNAVGGERATQVTVSEDASVLGRTLVAYGTPLGEKAKSDYSLPTLLDGASRSRRLAFAATYVRNRAGKRMHHGSGIQLREERPDEYLDSLADFFAEVTRADTSRSEKNIWLSSDAVDVLLTVPLSEEADAFDVMDPRRPEREAELIEDMRQVAATVERTPRHTDLEEHAEAPAGRFADTFGSLTLAQAAAGLPPTTPSNLPDEYLLAELDAVCEEAGKTVTAKEFDELSMLTAQTYSYVFGSWNNAVREIGREPNREQPSN